MPVLKIQKDSYSNEVKVIYQTIPDYYTNPLGDTVENFVVEGPIISLGSYKNKLTKTPPENKKRKDTVWQPRRIIFSLFGNNFTFIKHRAGLQLNKSGDTFSYHWYGVPNTERVFIVSDQYTVEWNCGWAKNTGWGSNVGETTKWHLTNRDACSFTSASAAGSVSFNCWASIHSVNGEIDHWSYTRSKTFYVYLMPNSANQNTSYWQNVSYNVGANARQGGMWDWKAHDKIEETYINDAYGARYDESLHAHAVGTTRIAVATSYYDRSFQGNFKSGTTTNWKESWHKYKNYQLDVDCIKIHNYGIEIANYTSGGNSYNSFSLFIDLTERYN